MEHVIFTLHWAAIYLVAIGIFGLLPERGWYFAPKIVLMVGVLPYLAVALHRVYGGSWWWTAARAPVLLYGFLVAQQLWMWAAMRLAVALL